MKILKLIRVAQLSVGFIMTGLVIIPLSGFAATGSAVYGPVTIDTLDPNRNNNTIQFDASTYSVDEHSSVYLNVTRTGESLGPAAIGFASVDYVMSNQTASEWDYSPSCPSGTLDWAYNESGTQTILISPYIDYDIEGDETFTVTLTNASGASLNSQIVATVTIVDNVTFGSGDSYSCADFDGDGKADPAVMNRANNWDFGDWHIWFSGSGYQLGGPYELERSGTAVAADFDGDGLADPAVVHGYGYWYIWMSVYGYQRYGPCTFQVSGTPVAADFDGDAQADMAVMSATGDWYIWFSGSEYQQGGPYALGQTGTPVAGDFDGDGLADPAVMSATGGWYIWMSGSGYQQGGPYALGQTGAPVAGDFDGDGLADPAVVSTTGGWYVWFSAGGYARGGPYALSVQ